MNQQIKVCWKFLPIKLNQQTSKYQLLNLTTIKKIHIFAICWYNQPSEKENHAVLTSSVKGILKAMISMFLEPKLVFLLGKFFMKREFTISDSLMTFIWRTLCDWHFLWHERLCNNPYRPLNFLLSQWI